MLTFRLTAIDDPIAAELTEQVQQFYFGLYGSRDETPIDPTEWVAPRGAFLVGFEGEVPVAMGGWRLSPEVRALGSDHTAEIKRMYVVPTARGRGYAQAMLAELERTAAEAGVEVMVLSTGAPQTDAIRFYVAAGYQRIEGFGHYRNAPDNRGFARRIAGGAGAEERPRGLLLYDADCGFCTRTALALPRWGILARIESIQSMRLRRWGVDPERALREMPFVAVDGTVSYGHEGWAAALAEAGPAHRLVGRALASPVIAPLAGRVYTWMSANRHRLPGGTSTCELSQH